MGLPEDAIFRAMIRHIWGCGQVDPSNPQRQRRCFGETGLADLVYMPPRKPRFYLNPEDPVLLYKKKRVTHYDFVWTTLGHKAQLLLYQAQHEGEIRFGAAGSVKLEQIGRIGYEWEPETREFREVNKRVLKASMRTRRIRKEVS